MKVLVTGAAGFIGSALTNRLLHLGCEVVGVDNHNDYYDVTLKDARVARLESHTQYTHCRIDLCDRDALNDCFAQTKPNRVVNLAAQAGVRYSIENPLTYINTNIVGFAHILEACRHGGVEHLVYASSSSVYGSNTQLPFSEKQNVDHPLSLYGASKKSNELMAHAYSHLYRLSTTGLRFFTVYGPWGRPDMALFKFTEALLSGKKLKVFNHGEHKRDFTYVDDIVDAICAVLDKPAEPSKSWNSLKPDPSISEAPWRIYNIGNNQPVNLLRYIEVLEGELGRTADIEMHPLQDGDVPDTCADIDALIEDFGIRPKISIEEGISNFVAWYKTYYRIKDE